MLSVQPARPPAGARAPRRVAGKPTVASAAMSRRYWRRVQTDMEGTLRSFPAGFVPAFGSVGDATHLLALTGVHQLHELLHERRVVVPRPRGDEVPVDDHRPVD